MKAFLVTDRNGDIPHAEIIFAETRGKAINLALDTEEFSYCEFTEMRARRIPKADDFYNGHWRGDWSDSDLRLILVKEHNMQCSEPDLDECNICTAREFCCGYESVKVE